MDNYEKTRKQEMRRDIIACISIMLFSVVWAFCAYPIAVYGGGWTAFLYILWALVGAIGADLLGNI